MTHIDTHVAAWLYSGDRRRMPEAALRRLAREPVVISPAVELELQLLFELGRIRPTARALIDDLSSRLGLRVSGSPFSAVVAAAGAQTWTRDPFDRLIVGNAHADGATLLTADETILGNYPLARWS